MTDITIYTIGFTKKSASRFFGLLKDSGAKHIVDVRLNNSSQLAGFAKRDDLQFFLQELCGMDYILMPELAPTQDILDAYKKNKGDWGEYEIKFLALMEQRAIEKTLSKQILNNGCLLCSEDQPHHCHRQLVIDYLSQKWDDQIKVIHLM